MPGRCNTQGVLPSKSLLRGNWETGVRIWPPCGLQGMLHSTCYNFRQCYEAHIRRRPSVNNFSVLTRTKASPNTEGKKKSKPSTCSIMRKRDATSPNVTTYYLNWWSLLIDGSIPACTVLAKSSQRVQYIAFGLCHSAAATLLHSECGEKRGCHFFWALNGGRATWYELHSRYT